MKQILLVIVQLGVTLTLCIATSVHIPKSPQGHRYDIQGSQGNSTNVSHNETNHIGSRSNASHDEHSAGIHVASLHYDYVEQPLIISVFLFVAGIAKLAFHHADFLSSRVPESCLLIILGVVVGAVMSGTIADYSLMPGLSSKLFFLYLLPPVILESAYSLHDRTFYENVGTVIIYAVLGTILNCFLIGPTLYALAEVGAMGPIDINLIQCLVFSAIIVAVDPVAVLAIFQEIGVNNVLYFLVFGESLLNDAVTVVLYNMMKEFNQMPVVPVEQVFLGLAAFFVVSLGGLCVGIIFGLLTAIITKYTLHVRVVEPLAVFVLAYISYLVAELFHFSGIISIIGCGLTQAQYAFHNISQKSHTTIKYFSKMQSSTSDCIIFLFLGIALYQPGLFDSKNWHSGLIIWTLVLCLLYRFIVVFVLTYFVNKTNRMRKIDWEEQFIMAYGGLRGAVAFSLVNLLENGNLPKEVFTTTTLCLIFFTVFVQGISIKPLVKLLRVKLQEQKVLSISEEINTHVTDHVMAGIEEVLGERGEHYVREILEYYNRKYLKNWLQRDPTGTDEHIMFMFEKIALQQHFENLAGSKMIQDKYSSTEGLLPADFLQNSIPEEEEDDFSVDSDSSQDTVLPSITLPSPVVMPTPIAVSKTNDISDEDIELIRKGAEERRQTMANIRKKSLFPGFNKRRESRHIENPTAKDVRKMLSPVKRDIPVRKLDKNLKDDSEADLLKYLQEKQNRTRRMSRCVLQSGGTPRESESNIHRSQPRKSISIDPNTAVQNYRRRLSLAVPEQRPNFVRGRSPSDVTSLRTSGPYRFGDAAKNGTDSPHRRRKLHKMHTQGSTELREIEELSPLMKDKLSVSPMASPLASPNKSIGGFKFDAIEEHEEDDVSENGDENRDINDSSSPKNSPSKAKLTKEKSVDIPPNYDNQQFQRSSTDPTSDQTDKNSVKPRPGVRFDVKSEVTKSSKKRRPLSKSKSVDQAKIEEAVAKDKQEESHPTNISSEVAKETKSEVDQTSESTSSKAVCEDPETGDSNTQQKSDKDS